MFTPLPITPHHPRESPGCLLQASSSTRNFLNALYMQLLQCRLSCLYFWHQCVLCWGNACIKACFLASLTCAQYMMLFDAYPIHMLFVASIFANSVQRGFHVVVLGFGSINGEGVVGCEVWRGKVEVMMASLLHGKGKGRSWVEEKERICHCEETRRAWKRKPSKSLIFTTNLFVTPMVRNLNAPGVDSSLET